MKPSTMRAVVKILRGIYRVYMPSKLKDKVTIISRQADEPTLDIGMLKDELDKRGVETVVLAKRLSGDTVGGVGYAFHMLKQMRHIAASKVIALDGYCIVMSVIDKKEGQTVVQMWHALGAVKQFGWQSVGKPWGSDEDTATIMKMHRNYDYVLAPSEATAEHYREAFGLDREGYDGKGEIKFSGLPRVDHLQRNNEQQEAMEAAYPEIREKINVLYVPTFRRDGEVDIRGLAEAIDLDRYNLIVKKHALDETDCTGFQRPGIIVDEEYSSMQWLKLCQKVITDYSAVVFEAALIDKEIYWYFFDEQEYIDKVGLNIDFREGRTGAYVYDNAEDLCRSLGDEYDMSAVKEFKDRYISADTENCTEQIADLMMGILNGREDR